MEVWPSGQPCKPTDDKIEKPPQDCSQIHSSRLSQVSERRAWFCVSARTLRRIRRCLMPGYHFFSLLRSGRGGPRCRAGRHSEGPANSLPCQSASHPSDRKEKLRVLGYFVHRVRVLRRIVGADLLEALPTPDARGDCCSFPEMSALRFPSSCVTLCNAAGVYNNLINSQTSKPITT